MVRKSLISLGLFLAICASVTCAMANSTVYTDDLGRLHFLGKDPGGKTLQQESGFANPYDTTFRNGEVFKGASSDVVNTPPNAGYERRYKYRETNVSNVQPESKAKGSFTYDKGAMDASDPYTYGETNIKSVEKKPSTLEVKKRYFWNK